MTYKVKALNPDSETEIAQLCTLYSKSYGPNFTATPVDASRFWKSRAGNRFTTLVVMDNSRFIASVSLRPDRDNPAHIQLYMPVCDLEYLESVNEIRAAMADLMHRLSLRQKWEMLYSYQFLQLPQQAWFSKFLLNGIDVAIWPSSLPFSSNLNVSDKSQKTLSGYKSPVDKFPANKSYGSVVISQRVLQTPNEQKSADSLLFAPAKHTQFCKWIYQSLGLQFQITSSAEEAAKSISSQQLFDQHLVHRGFQDAPVLALSADRRAIERHTHRQAGFSICFVEPSLTTGFKDLEKVLDRKAKNVEYIALNMLDPMTPDFAEKLESIGYGLGGVLPYHRNRHTLLYYKTVNEFSWEALKQSSVQENSGLDTSELYGAELYNYLKSKAVLNLSNSKTKSGRKTSLNVDRPT